MKPPKWLSDALPPDGLPTPPLLEHGALVCLRARSLDGSYHSARTPSIISISGSNYLRAGGFRRESPHQASRLHSLVSMDIEWIQVGLNSRRSSRTKCLKPELESGLDFSFPPSSTPAKDNTPVSSDFRPRSCPALSGALAEARTFLDFYSVSFSSLLLVAVLGEDGCFSLVCFK